MSRRSEQLFVKSDKQDCRCTQSVQEQTLQHIICVLLVNNINLTCYVGLFSMSVKLSSILLLMTFGIHSTLLIYCGQTLQNIKCSYITIKAYNPKFAWVTPLASSLPAIMLYLLIFRVECFKLQARLPPQLYIMGVLTSSNIK